MKKPLLRAVTCAILARYAPGTWFRITSNIWTAAGDAKANCPPRDPITRRAVVPMLG
ncbi:hypothetical protein GCM10009839_10720 [Catenulispora yoronensis]|uniref:Uncharacterized protein n=1 Tax=Catenulispora yoronensis TaxID=450799 RepID=A0ABN2TRD4_9ACTN